jgi:hypothetical protein
MYGAEPATGVQSKRKDSGIVARYRPAWFDPQ